MRQLFAHLLQGIDAGISGIATDAFVAGMQGSWQVARPSPFTQQTSLAQVDFRSQLLRTKLLGQCIQALQIALAGIGQTGIVVEIRCNRCRLPLHLPLGLVQRQQQDGLLRAGLLPIATYRRLIEGIYAAQHPVVLSQEGVEPSVDVHSPTEQQMVHIVSVMTAVSPLQDEREVTAGRALHQRLHIGQRSVDVPPDASE